MQQDAHEFLNYLLNTIADILQEEKKTERQVALAACSNTSGSQKFSGTGTNGKVINAVSPTESISVPQQNPLKSDATWVHEIFQGVLTNETRCLNCETVLNHARVSFMLFFLYIFFLR